MYIHKFFIDRDEADHLVDQEIYDMEGIGYASSEWSNGMDQLFAETFSVDGATTIWVSVYIRFLSVYQCVTALSLCRSMKGR